MKILSNIASKIKLKQWVVVVISVLLLLVAIVFTVNQQAQKMVKSVVVNIDTKSENFFIDEKMVLELMTNHGRDELIGRELAQVDLKELENRIKRNTFAHQVQVYKDFKGNIYADIIQCRPIARIMHTNADFYISDKGTILPMSYKFTANVMLITGSHTGKLLVENCAQDSTAKPYFLTLMHIEKDKFLKALVAEIDLNAKGEMTIYPQIGKQVIEFGYPEMVDQKFEKLKIFYKKIVPLMGWNKYSRVSLKFENQIVAE